MTRALTVPKPQPQSIIPSQSSTALMTMIEKAVLDPSFDVAKMDALLKVKERWDAEEARKAFVVALAAFKANPPTVLKNRKVEFKDTRYKHASLADASSIIGTALSQHGISHRWNVEQKDGKIRVTCILTHIMGHGESVSMECAADQSGSKNAIQAIGSATTYLQRYTLFAAAGIASQDDDDGRASGNTPATAKIAGPKETKSPKVQEPIAPTEGTDSFVIKIPFLFGTKDKVEFRGPSSHQKYRIDPIVAKTAKANFKDGDTAEISWEIRDGGKWIVDLDRKTDDPAKF